MKNRLITDLVVLVLGFIIAAIIGNMFNIPSGLMWIVRIVIVGGAAKAAIEMND